MRFFSVIAIVLAFVATNNALARRVIRVYDVDVDPSRGTYSISPLSNLIDMDNNSPLRETVNDDDSELAYSVPRHRRQTDAEYGTSRRMAPSSSSSMSNEDIEQFIRRVKSQQNRDQYQRHYQNEDETDATESQYLSQAAIDDDLERDDDLSYSQADFDVQFGEELGLGGFGGGFGGGYGFGAGAGKKGVPTFAPKKSAPAFPVAQPIFVQPFLQKTIPLPIPPKKGFGVGITKGVGFGKGIPTGKGLPTGKGVGGFGGGFGGHGGHFGHPF